MKAVIMAGGQGTRGRPYTEYFPKAMTPISDRPLIDHIIRYVGSFEFVDGIIIITDLEGLGGQIPNYYGCDYSAGQQPVTCADRGIAFVQDSQSGTGGDLLHASEMIPQDEPFVLWFSDNLCAVDLDGMRRQLLEKKSAACIATRTARAEETGFAVVDDNGIIRRFVEKPVMQLPSSECLGVYMLHAGILSRIRAIMERRLADAAGGDSSAGTGIGAGGGVGPSKTRAPRLGVQVNLSHDILQDLSSEGAISAFDIGSSQWVDVESPVILERNRARVDAILADMRSAAASPRHAFCPEDSRDRVPD